ncbi:hypothetical protein LTR05_001757 [Lithohypha guttulata]|uniref:Calcineurin-like phosphoesterase domain-containing protein n=1 Tax=Lithohypha guttulata TaxID=1690604 RepID=A0AAN7YAL4_9EURO|nr:hypothetical protein LTR05_001757 [Lithohypha guttulata]
MGSERIQTSFLIISDTRDLDLRQYSGVATDGEHNQFGFNPLPPVDVVLHCGNLTDRGRIANHMRALEGLARLPAELKLVIAGNHDIDLDERSYARANDGDTTIPATVKDLWTKSELALSNNIKYLEEGLHQFHLKSGATFLIHASPYTPGDGGSAFQYLPNTDRFNGTLITPEHFQNVSSQNTIVSGHIDILMTHGPPRWILDQGDDIYGSSVGCQHLRRAVLGTKPRLHCFGHIEKSWGAVRGRWAGIGDLGEGSLIMMPQMTTLSASNKARGYADLHQSVTEQLESGQQTLFVNAAVGNEDGKMRKVPWIVNLLLRKRDVKQE